MENKEYYIAKRSVPIESSGSQIRQWFTVAQELKKLHGDEVCDFSLGNPCIPPPEEYIKTLQEIAAENPAMIHGYMPNVGYEETRAEMAKFVKEMVDVELSKDNIIMTSGAAGALNVIMRTLVDPDEEVIVFIPFFPEYKFYTNGQYVTCKCNSTLEPDIDHFKSIINDKTRAVIVNSPNNPSGVIYSEKTMDDIAEVLKEKSKEYGKPIFALSDDPYFRINFSGEKTPSIFDRYDFSVLCYSFSKDLSIAGERTGFLAVNPKIGEGVPIIINTASVYNRTLGFVNCNAFAQRVVAKAWKHQVDSDLYKVKRDKLCKALKEGGFEFVEPQGAFYIFPKIPKGVEKEKFFDVLRENLILVVPGAAFGLESNFRLCYAVEEKYIDKALPKIIKAAKDLGL